MEIAHNSYCRFCAEPRSSEKLLDFLKDCKIQGEVMAKLTFLNAMYVNISNQDSLPKTICFICYESLNKAYEFLEGVKRAQDILTCLFTTNEIPKNDESDDEMFDDIVSSEPIDHFPDIKTEPPVTLETKLIDFEVKKEPKEDKDSIDPPSVNVHDFLDATMAIYGKHISKDDEMKNQINNWSEYPWVCSFCSIEFISMDMLRSHAKIVHGKCSAHFCIDCKTGKKDDFSAFIRHVRKHRKYLR